MDFIVGNTFYTLLDQFENKNKNASNLPLPVLLFSFLLIDLFQLGDRVHEKVNPSHVRTVILSLI
jgi:hypothetical protein